MSEKRFDFTHKGIGKLLKDERLVVPPNQRSYAWADDHIQELFQDLAQAVRQNEPDYFLGTVVLTQGEDGALEVADGQQRLATVTILLSRIRDYFLAQGRKAKAESINNDYLRAIDLNTEQVIPKLGLNVDDNEFFRNLIVIPEQERKKVPVMHQSNERIASAAKLAEEHIRSILSSYKPENHDAILVTWVKYLENQATVVVVTVPSYVDAFRMFETLNDRGLRASQADLLKNYMLSRARSRLVEAQSRWAAVTGALETISDDVDLVTYIRHFWITRDGPTRERELAERIKKNVVHDADAMDFLSQLEESAQHYVALFNQGHSFWNQGQRI